MNEKTYSTSPRSSYQQDITWIAIIWLLRSTWVAAGGCFTSDCPSLLSSRTPRHSWRRGWTCPPQRGAGGEPGEVSPPPFSPSGGRLCRSKEVRKTRIFDGWSPLKPLLKSITIMIMIMITLLPGQIRKVSEVEEVWVDLSWSGTHSSWSSHPRQRQQSRTSSQYPRLRPDSQKLSIILYKIISTLSVITWTGRLTMIWLKSFLVKKWSFTLYFLALYSSGKGSVPQKICDFRIKFIQFKC